jgi:hypothetical protein
LFYKPTKKFNAKMLISVKKIGCTPTTELHPSKIKSMTNLQNDIYKNKKAPDCSGAVFFSPFTRQVGEIRF